MNSSSVKNNFLQCSLHYQLSLRIHYYPFLNGLRQFIAFQRCSFLFFFLEIYFPCLPTSVSTFVIRPRHRNPSAILTTSRFPVSISSPNDLSLRLFSFLLSLSSFFFLFFYSSLASHSSVTIFVTSLLSVLPNAVLTVTVLIRPSLPCVSVTRPSCQFFLAFVSSTNVF